MSCGHVHLTPCVEVLSSVIYFIDGEVSDANEVQAIQVHLAECPPCAAELEHERIVQDLMQSVLRRSCNERAPESLHEQLHQQILNLSMGGTTEIITEFRMTEISIEINEFGDIEQHEITIEHTQEIRFPNEQ
ncbi:unannotated protein [freshwater metagenome]|uniref:Unannotated protein n=1 Tax=freshwater metagenome TaxID=449393 RepID=A0A6J7XVU0_9ZZZZ|nr:hypothetical protein [Actinomycetota bacterium]